LKIFLWQRCRKKIKASRMKKYASALIFSCALPEKILNSLPAMIYQTA
jgi:hypothetical protein